MLEQPITVTYVERRCRFIEDENLRFPDQGACDDDQLLLGQSEELDWRV